MKRAKRPVLATLLASALMLTGMTPVSAGAETIVEDRPGEMAVIGDAIFARPALVLATGVGLVLYTATLPLSVLGGNETEAGQMLVGRPGKAAFMRCLGCTPIQDERNRLAQRIARANPDEGKDAAKNNEKDSGEQTN
jgi:hypothetical protein